MQQAQEAGMRQQGVIVLGDTHFFLKRKLKPYKLNLAVVPKQWHIYVRCIMFFNIPTLMPFT